MQMIKQHFFCILFVQYTVILLYRNIKLIASVHLLLRHLCN